MAVQCDQGECKFTNIMLCIDDVMVVVRNYVWHFFAKRNHDPKAFMQSTAFSSQLVTQSVPDSFSFLRDVALWPDQAADPHQKGSV